MDVLVLQQRANLYEGDEMVVEITGSKAIVHGYVGGKSKYSLVEQVVGEWYDGSPVYQKTYVLDNPTSGGWGFIPLDTDISMVVSIESTVRTNSGSEIIWYQCIGMMNASAGDRMLVNVNTDSKNIEYSLSSVCDKLIVTLKYTK